MAARRHGRCREIKATIQEVGETDLGGVLDIERAAGHEFIEEPGAAVGAPVGALRTKAATVSWGTTSKYAFQDEQVEIFMAQGEAEVIAEAVARPVPFVVDRPLAGLPEARLDVLIGDDARAADRRTHAEALNQPSPARQPCLGGHRLFLEGSDAIIGELVLGCHGRKFFF